MVKVVTHIEARRKLTKRFTKKFYRNTELNFLINFNLILSDSKVSKS